MRISARSEAMTTRTSFGVPRRLALSATVALGLVLAAPVARAQPAQAADGSDATNQSQPDATNQSGSDATNQSGSDAASQSDSDTVTVQSHRQRAYNAPVAKAEAAAVAKDEAWREYRDSTPSPTPGGCRIPPDPSQEGGCATLEGSKDYPGLRTYVPQ
jgi:hypothetical protein